MTFSPQERIFFLQLILTSDRESFGSDLLKSFSKYFCTPTNIGLITDVHLTDIQKLADVGDVIKYLCTKITGFSASESLTTLFAELEDIKNKRIFLTAYKKLVDDFITKNTPVVTLPVTPPVTQQVTPPEEIITALRQEVVRLRLSCDDALEKNDRLQEQIKSLQNKYDHVIQSLRNINF